MLAVSSKSEAAPKPDPEPKPEALADPDPIFGLWKLKKSEYYDRYNYYQPDHKVPQYHFVPKIYRPTYLKKRIHFPIKIKKIHWWF